MQEEQEKIIINKRNANDLLYKLLENNKLTQIVRHFKVIIINNCKDENGNLVLSQNIENFNEDILYPSIDNVNNIIDDTSKISFGEKHKFINDIKDIINDHKNVILTDYVNNIINSNFTDEEKDNIERYLNNNDIYLRCGINPNDKNHYLIKLFELYIASYFNDLSAETQNKLLDESLLPMYNDTLYLSDNKYNFLINTEKIKTILEKYE